MRLLQSLFLALFALIALAAAAAQPQKSVIISWPSDTPYHVIDRAKETIIQAGGVITHEYHILKYA
jgi:spermidine/putrescine-binding protein